MTRIKFLKKDGSYKNKERETFGRSTPREPARRPYTNTLNYQSSRPERGVSRQPYASWYPYLYLLVFRGHKTVRLFVLIWTAVLGCKDSGNLSRIQMFCELFMDSYFFSSLKGSTLCYFMRILCLFSPIHHSSPPHRRERYFVLAIWCPLFHFSIFKRRRAVRWRCYSVINKTCWIPSPLCHDIRHSLCCGQSYRQYGNWWHGNECCFEYRHYSHYIKRWT